MIGEGWVSDSGGEAEPIKIFIIGVIHHRGRRGRDPVEVLVFIHAQGSPEDELIPPHFFLHAGIQADLAVGDAPIGGVDGHTCRIPGVLKGVGEDRAFGVGAVPAQVTPYLPIGQPFGFEYVFTLGVIQGRFVEKAGSTGVTSLGTGDAVKLLSEALGTRLKKIDGGNPW